MSPLLPPALLPAVAALAGVVLAPALASRPAAWALLLLAALGLRLGGRSGLAVAGLAAGLVAGGLDRPNALSEVDPERPVEALARVESAGRVTGEEWVVKAAVLRLRQVNRVWSRPGPALLHLPAAAAAPAKGELVRVRGYLRRSAGHLNTVPVPGGPFRLRVKSERLLIREAPPGAWGRLQRAVEARLPSPGWGSGGPGEALVRALVLGRQEALPEGPLRAMRRVGLGHVLALSGLHVSLLAASVALMLVWCPPVVQRVGIAFAVIGYLAIAGPSPSLARSSAMALLGLAALASRRRPLVLNALALVAAGLALASPDLTRDLAFRLSCSAAAGLILFGMAMDRRPERSGLLRWISLGVGASLAAQLASLPWALPAFSRLSPVSLVLNLVAVPWITLCLLLSFAWVGAAVLSPAHAVAAGPVLDLAARPMLWSELLPPSAWVAFAFPASPAVAAALALGAGALLLAPTRSARLATVGVCALLLQGAPPPPEHRLVEAVFFDVGQGSATLLRDGPRALLVDGGGLPGVDLGARLLAPNLAALGLFRLDAVVLTHPDFDHCGGLLDLARTLPIGELIVAAWEAEPSDRHPCLAALTRFFAGRIRRLGAGDRFEAGRWRLEVPRAPLDRLARDNDRSLVLIAAAAGRRLLLAGDAERTAEELLVRSGVVTGPFDLLQVPHHGSSSSSTGRFLAEVRPRLAVVSCGARNRFGHPGPDAIARLRIAGALVWRTDRGGMVRVRWQEGEPAALWRPLPASARSP
ncbi:MAG TPA: ComEC/Rec2 family competence protein [Thermoanaerobaculia bacterium]|nr:ComEC/Rec2 family competence protein [Thermoanaerobaculia bacterium]